MAAGNPLDDRDRRPRLELVGAELASWHPGGIIVACSALKRAYRDAIRVQAPATVFVQLSVDLPVLENRLAQLPGHFMPPSLLQSQLETLEALQPDEAGLIVPSQDGFESLVDRILGLLSETVPAWLSGYSRDGGCPFRRWTVASSHPVATHLRPAFPYWTLCPGRPYGGSG